MRGAGGWDAGTDAGVVCGEATGADGFSSAGDFAAAGKTCFCSTGAGGAGSFCAGAPVGTVGTGGGATGEGTCGFSSCRASSCFSVAVSDSGAGSFTEAGISTRITGTGVSFAGGAMGTAGRWTGSPATGGAAWTAAASWRLRSATSRWKEVCCLEFSSSSWRKFSRNFLYFPSRTRVIKGEAITRSAKTTTISTTRGMGFPRGD